MYRTHFTPNISPSDIQFVFHRAAAVWRCAQEGHCFMWSGSTSSSVSVLSSAITFNGKKLKFCLNSRKQPVSLKHVLKCCVLGSRKPLFKPWKSTKCPLYTAERTQKRNVCTQSSSFFSSVSWNVVSIRPFLFGHNLILNSDLWPYKDAFVVLDFMLSGNLLTLWI